MLPDTAVEINEEYARRALESLRAYLFFCNHRRKLQGSEPINMDYFMDLISMIDHANEVQRPKYLTDLYNGIFQFEREGN